MKSWLTRIKIILDCHSTVYNKKFQTTEMEDLIPPQIKDSCKLALPDGLNELMCDITREILRYQPRDLYKFIADYLSALLITRDNLSIAGYICNDLAQCSCEPELQAELRDIGLPEDEIKPVRDIIVKYLEKDSVQESSLIVRLLKDTDIDADMMPAVQDAIRNAFLRHQAHNTTVYESSSDECDEMMCAAKHTLNLYRKTAPSEETYGIMAEKIQKSYRAYGVRRDCGSKGPIPKSKPTKSNDKAVTLVDPKVIPPMMHSYDIVFPKSMYSKETLESSADDPEIATSSSMNKKLVTTISSSSLAGSFLSLPAFKPYSVHDCDILSHLDELPEREHARIDYTVDSPHISVVTEDKLFFKKDKKISFNETVTKEAKIKGLDVDDDSESKESNQNEPSMETEAELFYQADIMRDESNHDGDAEMEWSDESDDNNVELLKQVS